MVAIVKLLSGDIAGERSCEVLKMNCYPILSLKFTKNTDVFMAEVKFDKAKNSGEAFTKLKAMLEGIGEVVR